jgi:hypothetical protein
MLRCWEDLGSQLNINPNTPNLMATLLYGISALTSFICAIMVLIQLFKAKGALHGILGLFCGIYTFIWGWMNAKALNLSKIMIAWSASMVIMMATGGVVFGGMAADMQKQIEAAQKAAEQAAPATTPAAEPAK